MPRRASPPTTAPAVVREKLRDTVKNLIVDALVGQLAESGTFDLTYFALARRSGVSVRTIYRHFPKRDDLLDELSRRVNVVMGIKEYPRTRDGTVALVKTLFATFDQNAPLVSAQVQAGHGRVRARARHKRVSLFDTVFAATLPNLPTGRRRAAAGLLTVLLSANTWARMREETGIDGAQSGEVTAWAIDTLWRALEAEDRRAEKGTRPSG